jgi:hypothetical protein
MIRTVLLAIYVTLFLQPLHVFSQAINNDAPNFSTVPGFSDQRWCGIACFGYVWTNVGVLLDLGCTTNSCVCRPDLQFRGMEYISSCALAGCSDYTDASIAAALFSTYCSNLGYTSILGDTIVASNTVSASRQTASSLPTPIGGPTTVIKTVVYTPSGMSHNRI